VGADAILHGIITLAGYLTLMRAAVEAVVTHLVGAQDRILIRHHGKRGITSILTTKIRFVIIAAAIQAACLDVTSAEHLVQRVVAAVTFLLLCHVGAADADAQLAV
jgi:hypothetical protein